MEFSIRSDLGEINGQADHPRSVPVSHEGGSSSKAREAVSSEVASSVAFPSRLDLGEILGQVGHTSSEGRLSSEAREAVFSKVTSLAIDVTASETKLWAASYSLAKQQPSRHRLSGQAVASPGIRWEGASQSREVILSVSPPVPPNDGAGAFFFHSWLISSS